MSGPVGDNTARASGVIASAGGGAVLQVKSVLLDTTASVGGATTPAVISAFDIAFTPTADNSVLCLQLSMQAGAKTTIGGYFYDSTGAAVIEPYAAASGSHTRLTWCDYVPHDHVGYTINFTAWFTPGDTTTRTIQVWGAANGSNTLFINRTWADTNNAGINYSRQASSFTITEYDGSIVTLA